MRKVFYYFEGGLGDVLLQYFANKHITGLEEHRKSVDAIYVKAIVNTHNPQSPELLRYNSSFDEIQVVDFNPTLRDELQKAAMDDGFAHWGSVPSIAETPKIILGGNDEAYLASVLPKGPYIAIQPGAGKAMMRWKSFVPRLMGEAAHGAGYSVVLLGGTASRTLWDGNQFRSFGSELQKESLPHSIYNTVNLIGMANPRLACEIVKRSSGFIGTFSCYMIASMLHKCPGIVLKPKAFHDDYVKLITDAGGFISDLESAVPTPSTYHNLIARVVNASIRS